MAKGKYTLIHPVCSILLKEKCSISVTFINKPDIPKVWAWPPGISEKVYSNYILKMKTVRF